MEELLSLLRAGADFAHSQPLHILGDQVRFFPLDLALPFFHSQKLCTVNRVPLSCAAHALAPPGWPTDWFMFRKFLGHPDSRCASGTLPTALTFPRLTCRHWPREQSLADALAAQQHARA